jgi:hypothetical protein
MATVASAGAATDVQTQPPAALGASPAKSPGLPALLSAVKFGFPVLLEGVPEDADPALLPLLRRAVTSRNGTAALELGVGRSVDFDPRFRLSATCEGA